jgi:predicted DNA-binding transcriptional regulator AlpA
VPLTDTVTVARKTRDAPSFHHLDKRAAAIAAAGVGDSDDLLTTTEVAEFLGLSTQWVEIGRHKGYGPRYLKLNTRRVRYRRADILEWLRQRSHSSTAEYATAGGRPRKEAADVSAS